MPVGTRLTGAKSILLVRNSYSGSNANVLTDEVDTFLFPAKASATDGDYCVQWDTNGLAWAVALDTTGGGANTPTGAVWTAIPSARKVYLDIHTTTTAASVATAVKAGFNALAGFTSVVTASDAAADGHLGNTAVTYGVVTAPSVHNKGDSGAGSITVVVTTAGTGYLQLSSSTSDAINRLQIFDSSGSALAIATGAAGAEVDQFYVPPGGLPMTVDIFIPRASRLSIRAVDTAATTGQLLLTGVQ